MLYYQYRLAERVVKAKMNFEITGIDFERALSFSEEKVSIECSGENLYYLKDGHAFSRLKIVDNYMFGVCTVYMKCMNGTRFVYASMDISIGTVRETNFQNQTIEIRYNKRVFGEQIWSCGRFYAGNI